MHTEGVSRETGCVYVTFPSGQALLNVIDFTGIRLSARGAAVSATEPDNPEPSTGEPERERKERGARMILDGEEMEGERQNGVREWRWENGEGKEVNTGT